MPAYFDTGFFVRVPAWHGLGLVLDEYPGREEAMRLAGHNFTLVKEPIWVGDAPESILDVDTREILAGWNAIKRTDTGKRLHVSQDSYEIIQNAVPYDFAELLLEQGFEYETGITLKGGSVCALTLKLDEPIQISGDDSSTLPYLGLSWAHDGSGSFRGRSTSVRQVCANTVAASEAEGKRLGTDFAIRHTKNWRARVEDAKKAIQGVRQDIQTYRDVMEEFAAMPVAKADRRLFAQAVVLDQTIASVSRFKADVARGKYSARVQRNVENATESVLQLFDGPTIPEAHKGTAYGLHLAGVEYLDHIRQAKSTESYVGRTLLRDEPAKARLPKLIRELAAA